MSFCVTVHTESVCVSVFVVGDSERLVPQYSFIPSLDSFEHHLSVLRLGCGAKFDLFK